MTTDARLTALLTLRDQATTEMRNVTRQIRQEQRRAVEARIAGDRETERSARNQVQLLRLQQQETRELTRDIERQSREMRNVGEETKRFNFSLRQMAIGAGVALAAVGGLGAGMLRLASSYAAAGDEIQKMALRTGMSTEALSEFRHAAELSGANLQVLTPALRRVQRTIVEAAEGSTEYSDALARIGMTSAQLQAMNTEDQFVAIGLAINSLGSDAEKTAAAFDLFGDSGGQLIPMFADGAEGLDAMRQQARDLGLVFDQDAADGAAEFQDSLTELRGAIGGLAFEITSTAIPATTDLINATASGVKNVTTTIREVRAALAETQLIGEIAERRFTEEFGERPPRGTTRRGVTAEDVVRRNRLREIEEETRQGLELLRIRERLANVIDTSETIFTPSAPQPTQLDRIREERRRAELRAREIEAEGLQMDVGAGFFSTPGTPRVPRTHVAPIDAANFLGGGFSPALGFLGQGSLTQARISAQHVIADLQREAAHAASILAAETANANSALEVFGDELGQLVIDGVIPAEDAVRIMAAEEERLTVQREREAIAIREQAEALEREIAARRALLAGFETINRAAAATGRRTIPSPPGNPRFGGGAVILEYDENGRAIGRIGTRGPNGEVIPFEGSGPASQIVVNNRFVMRDGREMRDLFERETLDDMDE